MIEEYIKLLDDENEDMIGGLLKELEIEAPRELHEQIMKKLDKKSSVIRWKNFRRYASLAAGILVVFVGLGILSKGIGSDKKSTSMYEENMVRDNKTASKKTTNNEMSISGVKEMEPAAVLEGSLTDTNDSIMQMERVTIKTNQSDIIDFLRKRGEILSDNLYKLKYRDYEEFKKIEGYNRALLPQNESAITANGLGMNSSQEYILIELREE